MSYKKLELLASTWVHLRFILAGSVLFIFSLWFCALFVFVLCHVSPMLPMALDCPFLIAPSVVSNVYLDIFEDESLVNVNYHLNVFS